MRAGRNRDLHVLYHRAGDRRHLQFPVADEHAGRNAFRRRFSGDRRAGRSRPGPPNYEGLWWNAPAGSESGWGINFAHQGDTIFATWFTYDLTGKGLWLVMAASLTATGTYTGTLVQTTGPPFNSVPFNPAQVVGTAVGTGTLTLHRSQYGNVRVHGQRRYADQVDHPRDIRSAADVHVRHPERPDAGVQLSGSVVGGAGRVRDRAGAST